jgi:hypothetical protein
MMNEELLFDAMQMSALNRVTENLEGQRRRHDYNTEV